MAASAAAGGGVREETRRRRRRQTTSRAQEKNSGKFEFYEQKNQTKNFQRAVQALIVKGELKFF